MGVSGSGKTSVGKALAARLGWHFYDGDDFHPPENIAKMAAGIPLDDHDRAPWLAALKQCIDASLAENQPGVLACSALKEKYRARLLRGARGVTLVYLQGSFDQIWPRISAREREGHYMRSSMLQSQFETLEEPVGALTISVALTIEEIVDIIVRNS